MKHREQFPDGTIIDWYNSRFNPGETTVIDTGNSFVRVRASGRFGDVVAAYRRIKADNDPTSLEEWVFQTALLKNPIIISTLQELENSEPDLFAGVIQTGIADSSSERVQTTRKLVESVALDKIGELLEQRGLEPELALYIKDYMAEFEAGLE